ncbi:MAG TPA: DMT family transporter [Flavobacteriaceae bacterium]|nr:DMT family transporter [Flavobacteriaceae bacterium]HIP26238.1 DMT family transporter [Flavobacteriaceae bacterium]
MEFIILSVLLNASIFVIFKLFDKYKVDTFQAIVINYYFAFIVAYFSSDIQFSITQTPTEKWFLGAVFLGFLFVTLFYVMGLTAQKLGMSVVAVAGKMSVVIPVLFGLFVYNESLGFIKVIGITLALIAVYFTSHKENKLTVNKAVLFLPFILFFGSGILDTTLKYVQKMYVSDNENSVYLSVIFLVAGILGTTFLLYLLYKKQSKLNIKNLFGGLFLGIVNYFAMYFLLKALQTNGLESSTVFTINNVSIVLFSTLLGLMFFKEKLSRMNIFGILLAVVSIFMITFSI